MGIATPSIIYSDSKNLLNSMSQDYNRAGMFSFSNGSFDRAQQEQQQIRKDKLRMQGFEPPPPLVGMEEEEESGGVLPVYETAGMLQEMFSYNSDAVGTATALLENQISQAGYHRIPQTTGHPSATDWWIHQKGIGEYKNHQILNINPDSAAAIQLFSVNSQQQQMSPSPSPRQNPLPNSSTLHMMLPSSSSPSNPAYHTAHGGGSFGQFVWIQNRGNEANHNDHLPGVVEGQGLSLSLSSSLQQFEAAKAEEMRMQDGEMVFFGHGGGGSTYRFKNTVAGSGGLGPNIGAISILRNSEYTKAAQELLEEFCSVGRGQFKKNKVRTNPTRNPGGGGDELPPSKDVPPVSAAERFEHQKRKVKLLSMLDEARNICLLSSLLIKVRQP